MQAEDGQEKTSGPDVDFGFERVDPAEKTRRVHGVFERVARRYDMMNDLMSGGIHRLWKESFVDQVRPRDGMRILDVAGGTGDIAFRMLRRAPGAEITICDLTEDMLRVGRDRALDRGRLGVRWVAGNAEALPFPNMSLDAYTIAFGLRNVTDRGAALREARRVLKPGGRFFCLEFSRITAPMLERLYERYSFDIVPQIGRMVVGDGEPYRYLVESIRQFPDQEALAAIMTEAGLEQVTRRNLSGGIAAVHAGWRL